MQYLPELLASSKSLTLGNGEHLAMSEGSFKLLFETGDLEQASPAALLNMVSSTNIVYTILVECRTLWASRRTYKT